MFVAVANGANSMLSLLTPSQQMSGQYSVGQYCRTHPFLCFFPPTNWQLTRLLMLIQQRYHVIPTLSYYLLTNFVKSWNQPSEFLHRDKQNHHFGPDSNK